MKRIDAIWNHATYQCSLERLSKWEEKRENCRQTPVHYMDVARIPWIMALEPRMHAEK